MPGSSLHYRRQLVRAAIIYMLFSCAANTVTAQVLHLESSESRGLATSNLTSSISGTLNVNPALSHGDSTNNFSAGIAITPNEQGLSDASTAAVEGVYYAAPLDLSFSAGAARLAYSSVYSDVDAIVGLTKVFTLSGGRHASVGARFRYESLTYMTDFPPIHFTLLDLGFAFDLSSDFSIGGAAVSLLGGTQTIGEGTVQERPPIFMLGATYHPSDAPVSIFAALEEQDPFPLDGHLGISYTPVDFLTIRAGTTTDNGTISLGTTIIYDPVIVDLAIRFDHSFGSIVTIGLGGKW